MSTSNNAGILALTQQDSRFGITKIFDKTILTSIAISENGYIGVYQPGMTAREVAGKVHRTTNPLNPSWIVNAFTKHEDIPEKLTVVHISDVIGFDLLIENKSGLGGAIVGALIADGAGAIVGQSIGSNTPKSIELLIKTKNFNNPQLIVPLYRPEENRDYGRPLTGMLFGAVKNAATGAMQQRKDEIQELLSQLDNIYHIYQSGMTQGVANQQMSSADEIAKFKKLLDDGIISQEEFNAKKKLLLGV